MTGDCNTICRAIDVNSDTCESGLDVYSRLPGCLEQGPCLNTAGNPKVCQ